MKKRKFGYFILVLVLAACSLPAPINKDVSMNLNRFLLLLALPFYLLSCKPQQVLPNYLENLSDTAGKGAVKIPELRIQKNDQLFIQVYSGSKKPEASDVFYNLPASQGAGQGAVTSGFLVDVFGNID